MKFLAASTVLLAALVSAQNPDPFIDTPTGVTTCLTSALTFGGTHPPWTIVALPGGQASGTPIETIATNLTSSPYSWLVNLDEGSYITLEIRDDLGNLQYSSPITVIAGSSTSCVGTTPSSSSPAGGSSTTPSTGTSTGAGTTSAVSTTSAASVASTSSTASGVSTTSKASVSSTGSVASSTSSATHTTSTGAASHLDAKFGVAGLLGLIGAAVMV